MKENERQFKGLRVPEPPEGLRRQALSRSKQALKNGARPDIWSRIWESRQARLAWGSSVVALAVCHLLLPAGGDRRAGEPSTVAERAGTYDEELAVIADLPRLTLDARTLAGAVQPVDEIETEQDGATQTALPEENRS
jgi:hypothetical protein